MKFTVAVSSHEPQLRALAREETMPGWIRLAYTREPSWFDGQQVLGFATQTVVAEDDSGRVLGCGVRAIRRAYVNGRADSIGYLSGLRSMPSARRSVGLARGYRFFRQLHETDHLTSAYLTTILKDNMAAAAILTSGRAGLPVYHDRGRYVVSAIRVVPPHKPSLSQSDLAIKKGTDIPTDDMLAFLHEIGSQRQFFPVLERTDFGTPLLRGLDPSGFRVALCRDTIVGVTAIWDQRPFRQTLVTGYAPVFRLARPFLNAGLRLCRCPLLPRPGRPLDFLHLAFTAIRDDDPRVLASLLQHIRAETPYAPCGYFVIGLHEADPLRPVVRGFSAFEYVSRVYLVCWEDGRPFLNSLENDRIWHLETALL